MLWGYCQACNGIYEAEDEVASSEPSDMNHGPSQGRFNNAIAHANDEQQEEGEGVST